MKFMSRKNGKHDKNIVYTTWFICCATFYRGKISRLKWCSLSPKSRDTKPAQNMVILQFATLNNQRVSTFRHLWSGMWLFSMSRVPCWLLRLPLCLWWSPPRFHWETRHRHEMGSVWKWGISTDDPLEKWCIVHQNRWLYHIIPHFPYNSGSFHKENDDEPLDLGGTNFQVASLLQLWCAYPPSVHSEL